MKTPQAPATKRRSFTSQRSKLTLQLALIILTLTSMTLTRKERAKPKELRSLTWSNSQKSTSYSHSHTVISNGKKLNVEIFRRSLKGPKFLYFKKIQMAGKLRKLYYKGRPQEKWTEVPKGCANTHTNQNYQKSELCQEGWNIGKVIARTITFLALSQGNIRISGKKLLEVKNKLAIKKNIDMGIVTQNIRKVVKKTTQCLRHDMNFTGQSVKEKCIQKAMIKEAYKLIDQIVSTAGEHGFKCQYEALKAGKCILGDKKDQIEEEMEQLDEELLKQLNGF